MIFGLTISGDHPVTRGFMDVCPSAHGLSVPPCGIQVPVVQGLNIAAFFFKEPNIN